MGAPFEGAMPSPYQLDAGVIISPTPLLVMIFVLGEISFSILQMQRRLRPDSNPRLEATYRHSQTLASYRSRHRGRAELIFVNHNDSKRTKLRAKKYRSLYLVFLMEVKSKTFQK